MTQVTDLMKTFPAADDKQVTLANMQEGPFNRWAFRNLRRMLPTGNIWSGDGAVSELQVSPIHLDDIAFVDKDGAMSSVKQMLDEGYTDGFVVLHQGAIVAERYGDIADPHRPYFGIGIHGQSVFVDPVAGVVCAKHSTHPAPVDHKLFDDMFRAFKAISHALSD